MTSTISGRWWDSAVVWRRSIASIAILTDVSKPNVKSVLLRSLSIVFGTPMTLTPSASSLVATPRVSSPPIAIRTSIPWSARFCLIRSTPLSILNGLVRDEPRMVPPLARIGFTVARSRGMVSASSGPFQPSRNPTNSYPYSLIPFVTTPRITPLSPGQSPPPVRIPIRIATLQNKVRFGCN